jgi:hypothetical protein
MAVCLRHSKSVTHDRNGSGAWFSRVAETSVHTSTTDVMTSGRKRRNVPTGDEAPPHSITSSARESSEGGIVMPSSFAVLSITVVSFCWRILLIFESMGHHDSEIMDDGSID